MYTQTSFARIFRFFTIMIAIVLIFSRLLAYYELKLYHLQVRKKWISPRSVWMKSKITTALGRHQRSRGRGGGAGRYTRGVDLCSKCGYAGGCAYHQSDRRHSAKTDGFHGWICKPMAFKPPNSSAPKKYTMAFGCALT